MPSAHAPLFCRVAQLLAGDSAPRMARGVLGCGGRQPSGLHGSPGGPPSAAGISNRIRSAIVRIKRELPNTSEWGVLNLA